MQEINCLQFAEFNTFKKLCNISNLSRLNTIKIILVTKVQKKVDMMQFIGLIKMASKGPMIGQYTFYCWSIYMSTGLSLVIFNV